MKTTLRELIEHEVKYIEERMKQLEINIGHYVDNKNYESAAKSQIKYDTFSIVLSSLKRILNQ